jgi:hypothetical protein
MVAACAKPPVRQIMTNDDKAGVCSCLVIKRPLAAMAGSHLAATVASRRSQCGRNLKNHHPSTSTLKELTMTTLFSATALTTALTCALLATGFATPTEAASRHAVRTHADGGTTAAKTITRQGPQGGTRVRNRSTTADGQGNASTAGGASTTGPNGATAVRSGRASRSADGSAQRSGEFAASGAKGSVQTSGSSSKTADGAVNASRNTTATSATTGNSVQSTASYNQATGVTRSTTCYDAAGAAMSCPSR